MTVAATLPVVLIAILTALLCVALITAYYTHYQQRNAVQDMRLPIHLEVYDEVEPAPSSSSEEYAELERVEVDDAFNDAISESSKLDVVCSIVSDTDMHRVDSREGIDDLLVGDELLAIHFGHLC